MTLAFAAIIIGLALLVWSADRFVDGAAAVARHLGMPALLIGMVIIGFGTSAPEMVVSALAASQGNPGIALGNAYGSNITNIALILGLTALLRPISVHSQVLRKELPILSLVTAFAVWQLWDGQLTRLDAWGLLGVFAVVMGWSIFQGLRGRGDALGGEIEEELEAHAMPLRTALLWLVIGLILLILSSRALVWGAVEIAHALASATSSSASPSSPWAPPCRSSPPR
jgi:cation:H+ antiporter